MTDPTDIVERLRDGKRLLGEPLDACIVRWRRERLEAADEIERLRAGSVPDGWKLVPVEPTSGMVEAASRELRLKTYAEEQDVADAYRAMISASPKQGSEP